MKKLLSLLLALALLCCSLLPAMAETAAPVITVAEFKSAMDMLAKEFVDWDMEWEAVEDLGVAGNILSNPVLLTNGDYVTLAMVSFTIGEDDDMKDLADLFINISALTAACPAVRDGYAVTEAPDMVFADLQTMLGQLTEDTRIATGTLYGATAIVQLIQNDDGSIDITLLLTYTDPNAAV